MKMVFGTSQIYSVPDYRLFLLNFKEDMELEKLNIDRLKQTLNYLECKQRELERQGQNDTRSLDSMIKYVKKDMLHQFNLSDYDASIKHQTKNTENFILIVQNIIDEYSEA